MVDSTLPNSETTVFTSSASPSPATHAGSERENAGIIALAGAAAGLVGGLIVLLAERGKEEPKSTTDQLKASATDVATTVRDQQQELGAEVQSFLQSMRDDANARRKTSKKSAKKTKKKAKKASDDAISVFTSALAAAKSQASETAQSSTGKAGSMVDTLRANANDALSSGKAADIVNSLRSNVSSAASDAGKRSRAISDNVKANAGPASDRVSSAVETLKTRLVDAEKVAEDFVSGTAVPKLKEVGEEANVKLAQGMSNSDDLKKMARERGKDLRHYAEDSLIPQAKDVAGKVKDTVGGQSHAIAGKVDFDKDDATEMLSNAATTVQDKSSQASEAVRRGGRETRSLVVWLALAGTLIFYVFLDEEQQEKVKKIAGDIFHEAKDLYGDIQGNNG